MAKWKRSGLDAMNEYFANGGKKPSGMQTGQNSLCKWRRENHSEHAEKQRRSQL